MDDDTFESVRLHIEGIELSVLGDGRTVLPYAFEEDDYAIRRLASALRQAHLALSELTDEVERLRDLVERA